MTDEPPSFAGAVQVKVRVVSVIAPAVRAVGGSGVVAASRDRVAPNGPEP